MKVQVNYKYAGPNNKMRTGALIIEAPTTKDAVKIATDQLNKEYDWFKLTATVAFNATEK